MQTTVYVTDQQRGTEYTLPSQQIVDSDLTLLIVFVSGVSSPYISMYPSFTTILIAIV